MSKELVDGVALFGVDVEEVGDEVLSCKRKKRQGQLPTGEEERNRQANVQEAEMSSHHGERNV